MWIEFADRVIPPNIPGPEMIIKNDNKTETESLINE